LFFIGSGFAFAASTEAPEEEWSKTFGGSDSDKGCSVQQTNFALCKLDSNGKTIEEIEVISYEIGIHELKSVALTVTKKFVIRGMNFKISFPEVLHPGYGWILKSYDPEYVEYIGESYKAPLSGIIGTTTKVFIFKALKRGETEIVFADCELDRHGKPVEELKREKYIVKIY
jgi:hypothetical protein